MGVVEITGIIIILIFLLAFIYRSIRYYKVLNKRKLFNDSIYMAAVLVVFGFWMSIDKGYINAPEFCIYICAALGIILLYGRLYADIKAHKKQKSK